MSQDYLSDKDTLIVSKPLAKALGFASSVWLRRLRHWLDVNERNKSIEKHFRDGRWWSYNTYQEWVDDLEIFSLSTMRRTINGMEDLGLVISTNAYNDRDSDLTKWYSIEYAAYDDFIALWRHYDCPMYSDGKGSKAYNAFLDHWKTGYAPAHSGQGWMDLTCSQWTGGAAHNEQGTPAHSGQGVLLTVNTTPAHNEQRVTRESQRQLQRVLPDESHKTTTTESHEDALQPEPVPKVAATVPDSRGGRAKIFATFEEEKFGEMTPIVAQHLTDAIDEFGDALVLEALRIAVMKNKKFPKFLEGIFSNWRKDGVPSVGGDDGALAGAHAEWIRKWEASPYASFYETFDEEQTPPVEVGVRPPGG